MKAEDVLIYCRTFIDRHGIRCIKYNDAVVAIEYALKKILKQDTVYAFNYNPMIHESVSTVVSIHKTQKTAEMAMEFHKEECKKEWLITAEERKACGDDFDYGEFGHIEAWFVSEMKILD